VWTDEIYIFSKNKLPKQRTLKVHALSNLEVKIQKMTVNENEINFAKYQVKNVKSSIIYVQYWFHFYLIILMTCEEDIS
jgi:hypothetical protein